MFFTLPLLLMTFNAPAPATSEVPTRAASAFRSPITSGTYAGDYPAVPETLDQLRKRVAARRRERLTESRTRRAENYRRSISYAGQPGSVPSELFDSLSQVDTGFSPCAPICEGGSGSCE